MPPRKPDWLRARPAGGAIYHEVRRLLRDGDLYTVCESANCPNRGECFNSRTATFLLMGAQCTRACTFCNIASGRPEQLDAAEPCRIADAVEKLGLRFAVVTSVTRDDLPDGGAEHFAATIEAIRARMPDCGTEVLIPDFAGDEAALECVLAAAPTVLNHNLETVPRLYPELRPQADYDRSLQLLARARRWRDASEAHRRMRIKTGIMVGAGEEMPEVDALMRDCVDAGVEILTIGQYLQPTRAHHPVVRYVEPAEFDALAVRGHELGLSHVESGPLVRSSYHAHRVSEDVETSSE